MKLTEEELEAHHEEAKKISDYKSQIANLEAENQQLLAENTELKRPKSRLVKVVGL